MPADTITTGTTADIIDRFNRVFTDHDPAALTDLIGPDCVMEAIQPAPDGARTVGRDECLAFWQALADDRSTRFEPEEVAVAGERATIRWRYHFGDDPAASVRGVTLVRVSDGLIVEALGYSKTGDVPLAAETAAAEPGHGQDETGVRTTREVLDRYNEAFSTHDPELLTEVDRRRLRDRGLRPGTGRPAPRGRSGLPGPLVRARRGPGADVHPGAGRDPR